MIFLFVVRGGKNGRDGKKEKRENKNERDYNMICFFIVNVELAGKLFYLFGEAFHLS